MPLDSGGKLPTGLAMHVTHASDGACKPGQLPEGPNMPLVDALRRVCELQPQFNAHNTPAMQERGVLIRDTLPAELRAMLPQIRAAMDNVVDDLQVEGKDGAGARSRSPWVRVYSKELSPNAQTGCYFVFHFAADGTAVFVTVGYGSTVWVHGNPRQLPPQELAGRRDVARAIIHERWGTLAPFLDALHLGFNGPLQRGYEQSTVLAKRFAFGDLDEARVCHFILAACARLADIYRFQLPPAVVAQAGHATADELEAEIGCLLNPNRARAQGFGLSAPKRRAVELRAMEVAIQQLQERGYQCQDVSRNESFDVLAHRDGTELKVEVKGTTSHPCDAIIMTNREFELHTQERGRTCLIIVSQIRLAETEDGFVATDGHADVHLPWDVSQWIHAPIAFRMNRP